MGSLHPNPSSKATRPTTNDLSTKQNNTSKVTHPGTRPLDHKSTELEKKEIKNNKNIEENDEIQVNTQLIKIQLSESLSGLENAEILAHHYEIPTILIKSLFELNDKSKKKYLNSNNINNNLGSSGMGTDDVCKFILDLESEVIEFIVTPSINSWKLNPLNSYYRLLSHQIADYYHLGHILSNDGSSMVLFKINTSLVNADDETKKKATFDQSGNIKPLNFKNLKCDVNEKLNRIKLLDLFNTYKAFFNEKYIEAQNQKQCSNQTFDTSQNSQSNNKNIASIYTLPNTISSLEPIPPLSKSKGIYMLQRKVDKTNDDKLKHSNYFQEPVSKISSNSASYFLRGAEYKLAKERIEKAEDDASKKHGEDKHNTQTIVQFPNDIETFKPDRLINSDYNYNFNYDYNNITYNNNSRYRRPKSKHHTKINYNSNNYRYQRYGYYPTNHNYSLPIIPPQSNQTYGYVFSPNSTIPINSLSDESEQAYYYVPVVSPCQSPPSLLSSVPQSQSQSQSSPSQSLSLPGKFEGNEARNDETSSRVQPETRRLESDSGNNILNNKEVTTSAGSESNTKQNPLAFYPTTDMPMNNNIPGSRHIAMNNDSMKYQYYYRNTGDHYAATSEMTMAYYGDDAIEYRVNEYTKTSGSNSNGRNKKYWDSNKGGNYSYNRKDNNYNYNSYYDPQNKRYNSRKNDGNSGDDSTIKTKNNNQKGQQQEQI